MERESEKKLREGAERLKKHNDTLLAINRSGAMDSGDLEIALQEIAAAAARTLDCDRVSIWFFNEAKTGMNCEELFEKIQSRHERGDYLELAEYPNFFEHLMAERVLSVDDIEGDSRAFELIENYFKPRGVRAMMNSAIMVGGQVAGFICHENVKGARVWTIEEQNFSGSMADLVSRAVSAREKGRVLVELMGMYNQLNRLARVKDEFISNLSHELNTPLSAIYGYAELLKDGQAGDFRTTRRYSEEIYKQCEIMMNYMSDLLLVTEIETAPLPSMEERSVMELLERSLKRLKPVFFEKRIQVAVSVPGVYMVPVHEGMIISALCHIVRNAALYNHDEGSVRIDVAADKHAVHIHVEDSGIGIEQSDLDLIWNKFYRLDSSLTYKVNGVGLGLFLARRIVELHKGEIGVESEPGAGSRFTVSLPLS